MTNNLTVYGGEIISVQGKKKCVLKFEIEAPAAVPGAEPLTLRALMMCDPNYRDAILKALRRLERVPATAIKDNQEADPNGEEKDG